MHNSPYWLGYRVPCLRIFENLADSGNWLKVRTIAPGGTGPAYGAVVRVYPATGKLEKCQKTRSSRQ
ncbi:MAG: hypothetical protein JXQ83_10205 [Candidatus Glassbacteria bacterium]|nr:hypothetical protein [Candidatus Glassbacteria bacterium]